MDAKEQRKITRLGYALVAVVVFCCAVALLHGGCSRDDGATSNAGANSAGAAQQIERAADLNGLAEQENQSAREAITRADERAAEAAGINQRVEKRLESSRQLIDEIRADNQRAKQILDELIADHQAEPAQGEKN